METQTTIETPRVGWIGLGVMGASMCGHLVDAGFQVTLFTRTKAKAEALIQRGAEWADSPKNVAAVSDIVFSIVGMPADVREVILGDQGVLAGCHPGSVIVDMTTSEPDLAIEIAKRAELVDVGAVDAPVSGGDVGAKNGTLSIMVGGQQSHVDRVQPCFDLMGNTIVHQGPPGSGQHAKMVNQILVGAGMIGVCESLLYAHAAGLNLETVLRSVSSGAAGSWALSNLAPRIIAQNFDPGFFVEHFVKDLGIAIQESQRMKLNLPGLSLANELYQKTLANGHGKLGTQALQLTLAEMSGRDWESAK
ncbi:MAG: NAD(P)-dependent oxidoreductase [Planctomycetota bacterium]